MRSLSVLVVLFSILSIPAFSQTNKLADALAQANKARDSYDEAHAMSFYRLALSMDSLNLEAMYNLSLLISRKGWLLEDTNEPLAIQYHKEAKQWAEKTFKYYPNTFEGNVCMAAAIGRMAKYVGTKERVHAAWDIKKYADAAAKYQPNHPGLMHLLAWWNFELSKPTWIERSMADMLFGGLPKGASITRAIQLIQALIKYKPDYTVYSYDLAKFYEYQGKKAEAIELLKKVIAMTPKAPEDTHYIAAAKKKLLKLQ